MDKLSDLNIDLNVNEVLDEQNVNAIWIDLDKGLFSDNLGTQCEAIVKFTDLFDRFPLPVFVNNGFLKLAKIFQTGNNYLKLYVIRVIEKNEKHMDKITSVNELTKLIFHNIHSNDPLSRALTLHALAAFSSIIAEKQNVHHSIRNALESHDDIEAKEAIYAAIKFTAVSKSFADSVCDHITIMLEDISTPLNRKIKLLPILVNMHHDTQILFKANKVCRWMYDQFPRTDIRIIVLNILTKIAYKSLTNMHETLTFFIQLLHDELRQRLNVFILINLLYLANNASHLWTQDNVASFLHYLSDIVNEELNVKCLKILTILASQSNISIYLEYLKDPQKFVHLLSAKFKLSSVHVSFESCIFITKLLSLIHRNSQTSFEYFLSNFKDFFEQVKIEIYSIILKSDQESDMLGYLKPIIQCSIALADLDCQTYYQELFLFYITPLSKLGIKCAFYCNAFSGLLIVGSSHIDFIASNEKVFNEILKNSIDKRVDSTLQYNLLGLCLQLNAITRKNHNNLAELIELFLLSNELNYWTYYKLARLCVKNGFFKYSGKIYELILLGTQFDDSDFKHFIEIFQMISNAESNLVDINNFKKFNNLLHKLNEALSMYIKAQTLLKSIDSSNRNNSLFQLKYCELRSEQIKLYIHLSMATMTFHTNPAPKFLYTSSDSLGKYGRVATQMKYTLHEFQKVTLKYKNLMRECFDADENSINILNICKRHNDYFTLLINLLTCGVKSEQSLIDEFKNINANELHNKTNKMELQISNRFYLNVFEKMKILAKIDKESCMHKAIKLFQEILTELIQFHLPLPRGFFQSLQKTQIKLIVNSNVKKVNNIITLKHDQTLVLKIDGIIKQIFKGKPIRQISKIQINLLTEIDPNSIKDKLVPKYTNMQSCLEEPKNDYFNSQFLINFPFVGIAYILTIDAQLIDTSGAQWSYNACKQSLFIKLEEDPLAKRFATKVNQVNETEIEMMENQSDS